MYLCLHIINRKTKLSLIICNYNHIISNGTQYDILVLSVLQFYITKYLMTFDPLATLLLDCISTLVWTFACSISSNGLETVKTIEAGFSTHPRCLSLFILFLHSFLVSLLPEEEVLTRLSRGGAAFAVFV